MKIILPQLFDKQQEVATDPTRFRVLAASRRWGKTHLAAWCCLYEALHGKHVWWVAPTYSIGAIAWDQLAFMCNSIPQADIKLAERTIYFNIGKQQGKIQIKSADNETSLLGAGLDFCVIEEAAYIKDSVWYYRIRPTLSDKQGRALFISTPNGKNYFYNLWLKGQPDGDKPPDDGWKSWRLTCYDTIVLKPSEIESARQDMPARAFAREYLCDFADSGSGVFPGIEQIATVTPITKGKQGTSYVAGLDVGRHEDFTVIATFDENTREVVNIERFTGVNFKDQLVRIIENYQAFKHRQILVETNSIGQGLFDEMRSCNLPVKPFVTTLNSKRLIIEKLMSAVENARIAIPNDPDVIREFLLFEEYKTARGERISYRASRGHDDIVIAVALAYNAASEALSYMPDLSKFNTEEYSKYASVQTSDLIC